MVKIEELLEPDERIIKKQGSVTRGRGAFGPIGTLYLTNKRVIFLPSKLMTAAFSADIISTIKTLANKGLQVIPLDEIENVKSSFGAVVITAGGKTYTYTVSVWKTKGWVNAINQAIAEMSAISEPEIPVSIPKTKARARKRTSRRSRRKKSSTTQRAQTRSSTREMRYCPNCGAEIEPSYKFCPSCGHPLR
ncbi:MAG: hypothetical protein DRJ66_07630 [Thermoprotei archaeon]|nr:MAG: hypothetical protein DRJ66_07630 [Thermoprotei archaeon]RLF19998.1 MAG: hypothetical protein DRZ82_03895 [Thermoprotei archaeon]